MSKISIQTKLFKLKDKPMYFSVTEYEKFIDNISDSTFQLIFKQLFLVEFE